jgi:hypothetical protein
LLKLVKEEVNPYLRSINWWITNALPRTAIRALPIRT